MRTVPSFALAHFRESVLSRGFWSTYFSKPVNFYGGSVFAVSLITIMLADVAALPARGLKDNMTTYVPVHCAQGGGWAWKFVAAELRAAGHDVWAPSLTGLGDRAHLARPDVNLETHIQDIVNLIEFEDLSDVVLVGWSYGGMVVTGVADRLSEKLSHVVFLDAEVPEDGQSLFDLNGQDFRNEMETWAHTHGDGWLTSFGSADEMDEGERGWISDDHLRRWYVEKLAASPQPIETYRQPIRFLNSDADTPPRTFFRFPVHGEMFESLFAPIAERFRSTPRWNYVEVQTNHCGPLVAPKMVAEALMSASADVQ